MMMSLTYDIPYLQIVLGDLFPKHIVCAKSIEKTEICTGCTIIFSDNSSSYTVSHISCIILMNMYCSVAYTENTMLQTNEMNEKNLIFYNFNSQKFIDNLSWDGLCQVLGLCPSWSAHEADT